MLGSTYIEFRLKCFKTFHALSFLIRILKNNASKRGFIIHDTVSGLPLNLLCPSSWAQSLIEELIGKEEQLASYFVTQRSPTLDISFLSFKYYS